MPPLDHMSKFKFDWFISQSVTTICLFDYLFLDVVGNSVGLLASDPNDLK
jgi:hypothetical protein